MVVEWDQPYVTGAPSSGGATSSIDLCVTGGDRCRLITDYDGNTRELHRAELRGFRSLSDHDHRQPGDCFRESSLQNLNVAVGLAANSSARSCRAASSSRSKATGSAARSMHSPPTAPTLQGHPGAAGAAAVGAAFYFQTPACGTTPAALEPFSSQGGAPILFDTSGTRLATPLVRQKPDFVGPDGVNNTFLGFTLASDSPPFPSTGMLSTSISQCQNDTILHTRISSAPQPPRPMRPESPPSCCRRTARRPRQRSISRCVRALCR